LALGKILHEQSIPFSYLTRGYGGKDQGPLLVNTLRHSHHEVGDEFNFFRPLLETLNRKDETAMFFLEVKDSAGAFPLLGIEQKMDGAEVSRLEVSKVTKAVQKPALFEIPAGYNKFERN
jgi:hypothetical protein